MRFKRPIGPCISSIALALLAAGPTNPALAEKPVDLVLDVPAAMTLHYKISQETEGTFNGLEFSSMMNADLDVSPLESKGENLRFQVVFVRTEASRRLGDEVQPQELGIDGMKAQAEVTKRGKMIKLDPPLEASQEQQKLLAKLADAVFVELPAKPVKPEDTWTLDLGDPAEKVTASGDYTLESIETKDEVQVARIAGETKMKGEAPPMTGKGKIQAQIAVDGGYLLSVKGENDLTSAEGPALAQSFEIRLER